MSKARAQGLTCPSCTAVVPVPEGVRIVTCPSCSIRSLVQGERGIRRWQVINRIDRQQAEKTFKKFFVGYNKALDLRSSAKIRELFLIYLPYWRVQAFVAGWIFGRVKKGKDDTAPIEVQILEEMHWNDAATDVSEFGVHRVSVTKEQLEPYESDRLHAEGMVFEPVESADEAQLEAQQHFTYRARKKRSLKSRLFEKFHFLRQQLSLVYYPLWVGRYEYRKRNYQVVIDGVDGKLLYGKAPGNAFYRAAMLVAGMAFGNLILVNGLVIGFTILGEASGDDEIGAILFVPVAIGIALIVIGYRKFRYGAEIEQIQDEAKKATLSEKDEKANLLETGMKFLDEMDF